MIFPLCEKCCTDKPLGICPKCGDGAQYLPKSIKTENPLLIAPKIGDVREDSIGRVRVMAVVEGYVMFRRKGCIPGLESINNFNQRFKKLDKDND